MELLGQLNDLERSYQGLEDLDCSPVHAALTKRMRKTLYAGRVDADGISLPLTDIVVELFENADQGYLGQLSKRHVANLTRRSNATQCSLFLSMMYTKRLRESNPDYVTRIKPAELFLVSMMIATKFLYDEGEEEELYNDEWADAAKMDVNRVHDLEREFLEAIDWRLLVDPLDFYEFLLGVETRIALSESRKRGWLTYTDLSVLMQLPAWYKAWCTALDHTLKVISVCTLVYGLCTAVTVWSMLLMQQAHLQPRPTNGCLPFPLGPHQAKSTEPRHPCDPTLLDPVLCLNQDHEEVAGFALDAPTPRAFGLGCSATLESIGNPSGCDCQPALSRDVSAAGRTEVEGSCRCPSKWTGPGGDVRGVRGHGAASACRCPLSSWSQTLARLTAQVERLRETLVVFYGALLAAWSEIPPGISPGHSAPLDSTLEGPATMNSSDGVAARVPHGACSGTLHCEDDSPGYGTPTGEGRPLSPQGERHRVACSFLPTTGERWLLPQLLASDQNLGFRTRSEILVTM